MGRWLPGAGNKREQMNQSKGVFIGNTDQSGRNCPCEPSCAFAHSSTEPFLLGKVAALGTQPTADHQQSSRHGWEANPILRILGSRMGVWEWKEAAATLHLAWGGYGVWQSRGGSHSSHEAVAMRGDQLAAKATKQGEHPRAACRGGQGGFCNVLPSLMSWQEAPLPLRSDLLIPTDLGLLTQFWGRVTWVDHPSETRQGFHPHPSQAEGWTQLGTAREKIRKTAVQRRDGGKDGSQTKHDPAVRSQSCRCSRWCSVGNNAASEQGGSKTSQANWLLQKVTSWGAEAGDVGAVQT